MPALQSPWFVPHVVVYLVAYAFLGFSTLVAFYGLYTVVKKRFEVKTLQLADNIVYIGFSFLTLGIIFGALWAKVAWGHYWTWDPKETWALLTWLVYLVYMHYRYHRPKRYLAPLWTLAFAFVVLILTWFFLEMLPAAQNSVHVYSQTS
jgi:ABC-type transport system involved in cytochrome c biogenesis permease subunit